MAPPEENKMAVLGLIILAVIIFFAVFADVFLTTRRW